MTDLQIYKLTTDIRNRIASAMLEGIPISVVHLVLNDIDREIVKPMMERAIKVQTEKANEAEAVSDPVTEAVS